MEKGQYKKIRLDQCTIDWTTILLRLASMTHYITNVPFYEDLHDVITKINDEVKIF